MKNKNFKKAMSVFLSVLMLLSCWVWVAPTDAAAANKYYVKVYVNIYDGSDGYGGAYTVEESTGKPKNYSWATNDGWYGRINMTGFTVFGENGDYDAQDVSEALLEAEKLNTYYDMSGLSDNNANGDWDSKAIAKAEYTFVLDSFPVEIFWMNDENNWDGGNTGFAIRKLTVATSEGGTEHTMWEGLAGSDSETYNYYGSITPTGIHTCFEDYAKNYDMNDYKFYKAITSSSQRAWTDPYTYGSAGTYYLNEYANGGVSATFSEGTTSVASTVDYIDTSSTDTYYVNYTNHSKTQIAEITGTYNDGNFVSSPYGIKLNPGETRSFEINKSNYSKLAKYNNAANFTFEYTLSDVYASDELNAPLAKFTQPTYIGLWNESSYSKSGTTFSLNNIGNLQVTFQTTEGILETVSTPSGKVDHASVEYRYYIDNSVANNSWEKTGLRFYITETNNSRVHFQNKNKTAGTMRFSGPITNTTTASLKMADFAFNSVTENFVYNVSATATYNNTVTPTWVPKESDSFATFWNDNPAWVRFGGTTFEIDPSADNQYATILLSDMLFNDYYNYQAKFSASIDVYAVNKAELRKYVRETLLDFAPMSLRYNTTAFENYQNKLASAMNVLADQKTTQKAVTNALAELKSAVEDLQSTDNLINQVSKLSHTQFVDDIGSSVAASIPERYVLVPLGEHTVPQNTAYIGNGTYKDNTNKKSNLTTNYAKTDTTIEDLKYYYWNIEFAKYDENRTVIDYTIESLGTALNSFDDAKYSAEFKEELQKAKEALEAIDQNDGTNTPSTQEEVETAIINADNLLAHLGNNMRVHQWIEDDNGNYVAESDKDTHWYICKICGYELVYNHTFAYEKIDAAEHKATCVTSGTDEGCGYSFTEDHIWVEGETVATSCTEANKSFSCICGATKTEAVTVSNHNFVVTDNGDGTHISKCSKCDANETDAVAEAHKYTYTNNNDGTHTATCSVCAAEETVSHLFTNPELARPTYNDATGKWENGTYTYTCICGAIKVEAAVRADYSELEEAIQALEGIKDDENLSNDEKTAINNAIAEGKGITQNLVTAEQDQIDALVKKLEKIKADADKAIENAQLGVKDITEATSGVKVQFIDKSGLGAIDSIQLGKDDGFIIRVANGNADSNIIITEVKGDGINETADQIIESGKSVDFDVTMPTTAGIKEYTITYTIDGLKDADGNLVEFTTNAYLYVKGEAYQPYHYVDEKCANGSAHPYWNFYLDSTYYGDFELVHATKAPYDAFGNENLIQDGASITDYVREQYDYENDSCYAGCTTDKWASGDAHAATYRYYIDTSLADTYEKAGLRARLVESTTSNYDNAPFIYVRLANNESYLDKITGTDKTFSVTLVPSATSNVPAKTWTATSNGDDTVSELRNSNEDEWIFGAHAKDSTSIATGMANFTGAIPQKTEDAKLMFSWRMEFNKGTIIKQAEAVTMTTHLYITSYDKAALREAVANAEQAGFNSEYFNEEKYEAYENALKNAKEVLGKAETNQNEIDAAVEALNTAIEALKSAEAKFVLTVTHSIHESADKNSEATSTEYDYYLVNGDITPDLKASIIALETINKYDDAATLNVTADATHTYNYWFINYSAVQGAINAADEIIENADDYSQDFINDVTEKKEALEDILEGKDATTAPESQADVDDAIKAVTDLTDHTCNEDVEIPAEAPTCTTDGLKAGAKCSVCGKITVAQETDPKTGHNYDKNDDGEITRADAVYTAPVETDGIWSDAVYTYTCQNSCGESYTETVARADYEEYDKAVEDLNDLLDDTTLTEDAKKKINEALEENDIADNLDADSQQIVTDAAEALKDIINEITGENKDKYTKVDFTDYNAALEIYNNTTVGFANDTEKETVQAAIDSVAGITAESAKVPDNQTKINAATAVVAAINAKYGECAKGNHDYESVTTQPTCTAQGYTTHTCKVCGDGYTDTFTGPNGHDWSGWELTTAPTATEDGTYTRTCSKGDATETKSVAREDYSAYDEAIKKAEELLKKDELTQTAKDLIEAAITEAKKLEQNLPEDVVENGETIINNDSAEKIAEATGKLNEVLNGIVDEEGNLKDEYKKPDTKAAEDAVEKAEALEGKIELPADVKTQIENLRTELDDILDNISKDDNATEAEYKDDLKKVEDAANVILNKYAACEKDGHKFGDEVIATYPVYNEETKTWSQGTYTKTCSVCGYVKTIAYDRANYEVYDKALTDLNALLANDNITEATKTEIREVINKNTIRNDLMTPDQDKVTAAADALKAEVDKITNDTTGAYEKVDYTKYNNAVDAYKALDSVMTAEDKAAVEAIKAEIAKIPADGSKKDYQTQVDKAAADIAAINGKYGECATGNHKDIEPKNHICDICGGNVGEHIDSAIDNDHVCDYGCGVTLENCSDADNNHKCDICGATLSECADTDKNHNCDICGTEMGTHADSATDSDHVCDYGCGAVLEDCADNDKNHNCDICGTKLSDCADNNNDHKCDVCGTKLSDCADNNNDHNCDKCGTELSECADNDNDHKCDTCGTTLSTCVDSNNDHKCDICGVTLSECADEDKNHKCDLCGTTLSECADTDKNHNCDICGTEMGTHADTNNDHNCEYCNGKVTDCVDADTDADHNCDICGAENVTEHNYVNPVLTRPTKNEDGTWNKGYYTSTCNCGGTSTTDAERANYEAYDKAVADLNALLTDETLTDAAKTEITNVLNANKIADNYIATAEEQKIVNDAAAALKVVLDKYVGAECTHKDCAVTVVAPTCHSLGYTLHVCKNCNYAYRTDEKSATNDHAWGRWYEKGAASCMEYRMHERSCLNEGCYEKQIEIMRDADGNALYGSHYVIVIEGQDATCISDGYTDYERCVLCGQITEAEVIPATGHVDNNKNGNCDTCNYVINPSIGKCDCLCHNDSFFGKLLYNFVNFFWKLFKIQQGCECGAQHW